jgi:hypothetical protein
MFRNAGYSSIKTNLRKHIMSFSQIFKDNNDYNEKTIIGFMSFAVMVFTSLVDLGTGVMGIDFNIHEYIYNSFVIITLGSFGIAGVEKFAPQRKKDDE